MSSTPPKAMNARSTNWRRTWPLASLILTFTGMAFLAAQVPKLASAEEMAAARPTPELTHSAPEAWINSPPLTLAELRGRVVLVDFWAFECWNCYRSFPWLNAVEDRYEESGLLVIGVHTPEFDHEKKRESVVEKVKAFKLRHPVMMDNDYSYWRAMNNRYWPAFYLIDKQGRTRYRFVGETHAGDRRAQKIEAAIERLLQE